MTLTIELSPDLARRIEAESARLGQTTPEYARTMLEAMLTAPLDGQPALENPLYHGLPRASREELDAILQEQGVKPVECLADLKGDFWPEEDSIDEFIATVRRWRREEP
jgi:hypothetical protein